MSSPTRTAPPRLLEQVVAVTPWRARLALTSSGVWAALQAVALSYAVVALFAVVAVLDAPSTSGPDGGLAAGVGVATGLWLLAHGVPLTAGAATVTLVPLGLTALMVFTAHVSAKRSAAPTLAAWLGGTVLYTAAVVGLVVALDLAGTATPDDVGALVLQLGGAVLGGVVVGGGGLALGMFSAPDGPLLAGITPRLDPWVPDTLRLGLRGGVVGVAMLTGLAGVLVGVWVVSGRDAIGQIAGGLGGSWLGVTLLATVQLLLVPNLVLWGAAWLAGPGFVVGTGSSFTTTATQADVLPALPLLGALPGDAWTPSWAGWAPVLVVACGAVAGWFAWRNLEPGLVGIRDVAWILAGTTLSAGAVTVVLQQLAGGSAGGGRLADLGADPWITGGIVAAEVGAGAAVVLLVAWAVAVRRRPAA